MTKSSAPLFTLNARHPELTEHNLEHADAPDSIDTHKEPIRDVSEADFGAEAHGFTGYELAGRGSRYKSSPDNKSWLDRIKQAVSFLRQRLR